MVDGLAGDDDRRGQEKEILLYKEAGNAGHVATDERDGREDRGKQAGDRDQPEPGRPVSRPRRSAAWPRPTPRAAIARSSSTSPTASATAIASNYHDDKDHQPRCRGEVALADAVIALTSNMAMRQKRRIEFDPAWFDPKSDKTPEAATAIART